MPYDRDFKLIPCFFVVKVEDYRHCFGYAELELPVDIKQVGSQN